VIEDVNGKKKELKIYDFPEITRAINFVRNN
jgi:hypothetical protein